MILVAKRPLFISINFEFQVSNGRILNLRLRIRRVDFRFTLTCNLSRS